MGFSIAWATRKLNLARGKVEEGSKAGRERSEGEGRKNESHVFRRLKRGVEKLQLRLLE